MTTIPRVAQYKPDELSDRFEGHLESTSVSIARVRVDLYKVLAKDETPKAQITMILF